MSDFVLYSYYRSSAAMRVRIALHLKKIEFEYRAVDLLKNGGEQHAGSYGKLNPSREVPTLLYKGQPIGQSVAIVQFLDDIRPTPRLFPEDPYRSALVRQACEIINSGSQPIVNHRVDHELERVFHASKQQLFDWTAYWAKYGLVTLEELLKQHAGTYAFGDEFTAADCFIVPHLMLARRFKVNLNEFPTIMRVDANCAKLEAVQKASMMTQVDTPPGFKIE